MEKEVYLIYNEKESLYKIGVSKNSQERLKQLQTGSGNHLEIRSVFITDYAHKIEKSLHRRYSFLKRENIGDKPLYGEWFCLPREIEISFNTECREIENNLKLLYSSGNPFIKQ